MISLTLNNAKNFMAHLLLSDTFDNFVFLEGKIITFCSFHIDGSLQRSFFDTKEPIPEYCRWKDVKEFCFSVIRGTRTPLGFKFIFSLSPENIRRLVLQNDLDLVPEQVQGLYLNIRFEDHVLQCVTGTSLKTFSMDRSLDTVWDLMVQKFFAGKGIAFSPADSA